MACARTEHVTTLLLAPETRGDFAQQLVRAKDSKEIVSLQQEFLRRQVEQMNSQLKELGERAAETTRSTTDALKPKS